jgi:hypothetical protein
MNPNKLKGVINLLTTFKTQFDDFPGVVHRLVERPSTRVAQ